MMGVPVFWSIVIGIISILWFLRSKLSAKTAEDDDYLEIRIEHLTNYSQIEKKVIQQLPETNAFWRVGITVKSASVTEDTHLRLMEFRSTAKITSDYVVALL